jgi:hypothetical protein
MQDADDGDKWGRSRLASTKLYQVKHVTTQKDVRRFGLPYNGQSWTVKKDIKQLT